MTPRERLLIVGSSGHAKVVIDIAERCGHEILGLVDDQRGCGERTMDYAVVGTGQDVPALVGELGATAAFVAVGDNFARADVVRRLRAATPGLRFATLVHPAATVAREVLIGAGSVVMAGAVVNPGAAVGQFCILNTAASLDHDSRLGDHASLAPGVRIGGDVDIGPFAAVGIGASVAHRVRIGEHTVVGAGATVVSELAAYCVAFGVPARAVRARRAGERYL